MTATLELILMRFKAKRLKLPFLKQKVTGVSRYSHREAFLVLDWSFARQVVLAQSALTTCSCPLLSCAAPAGVEKDPYPACLLPLPPEEEVLKKEPEESGTISLS